MTEFKNRGIMIDCSRNAVMNVATVKRFVDIISSLDYNILMLYTEDTYEIKERPYFGYLRGRYTHEELKEIDDYCFAKGVELVPCIQTLAHLDTIVKWDAFSDFIDCDNILLVDDDRTYALIEDMFRNVQQCFRSRKINICMDEAHNLGLGKYLREHGYTDPHIIMKKHLDKVAAIAEKYGFEPMMWSDMFFRMKSKTREYYLENPDVIDEETKNMVPDNVSEIYWDYYYIEKDHYEGMMKAHSNFHKPFWFAGGIWTWTGFTPHNHFTIETSRVAIECCREYNVENVFFTLWGDDTAECSFFAALPGIYYVSRLLAGETDDEKIKAGFRDFCGIDYDDFTELDIPRLTTKPDVFRYTVNPTKYMLYNDYFLGVYDTMTDSTANEDYKMAAEKLSKLEHHDEYGYIFKTIRALCEVLSLKNDIGLLTRKAYQEKNIAELTVLADRYLEIEKAIKEFYRLHRERWYKENKTFGFEIQELRLGSLILRTQSCRERLLDYIAGKIDKIEELEQEILPMYSNDTPGRKEIGISYAWKKSFANKI